MRSIIDGKIIGEIRQLFYYNYTFRNIITTLIKIIFDYYISNAILINTPFDKFVVANSASTGYMAIEGLDDK